MKNYEMEPIFNKIKEYLEFYENCDYPNLVIMTDSNSDNLSYCKGIARVNKEVGLFNNIVICDLTIEEEGKVREIIKDEHNLFYIMSSVKNHYLISTLTQTRGDEYCIFSEELDGDDYTLIHPTAYAIREVIQNYVQEKEIGRPIITVCSRSDLIGMPLIKYLLELYSYSVIPVHSQTNPELRKWAFENSDVIVTAAGRVNSFELEGKFKDGMLIVDAGCNFVDGKMVGDWNYENLKDKNVVITPNPGGIGKLTSYMLLFNITKEII